MHSHHVRGEPAGTPAALGSVLQTPTGWSPGGLGTTANAGALVTRYVREFCPCFRILDPLHCYHEPTKYVLSSHFADRNPQRLNNLPTVLIHLTSGRAISKPLPHCPTSDYTPTLNPLTFNC